MGLWDDCVLVTGAAGTIGSELVRLLVQRSSGYVVAADIDENGLEALRHELECKGFNGDKASFHVCDLKNRKHLDMLIEEIYRPTIVVHCAAHKHVSTSQDNISQTIHNNLTSTLNVVEACRDSTIKPNLIHISTDKAVQPTSIMGASKTLCESIVLSKYSENARILRSGNIVGSQGSVIRVWLSELQNDSPFTITDWNMRRYLLTPDEIIECLGQVACEESGVYVVAPQKELTVRELFDLFCEENDIANPRTNVIGRKPGEKIEEVLFWPSEGQVAIPRTGLISLRGSPVFEYYSVLEVAKEFDDMKTLEALRKVLPSVWVGE